MRLTKKLLGFLNRVFSKDPEAFLALRLGYAGGMAWRVSDAVLTTTVTGGIGAALRVNLVDHSLRTLIAYLSAQPGYTVLYGGPSDMLGLSARVLLDGGADIATSNGDHLYGYTSVLFAYAEAAANELQAAEGQIAEMLQQMSTKTAAGEWIDELGGYYGIPRLLRERDQSYAPRIITEVLRPRANNIAIEMAIEEFTGQKTKVTDAVVWGDIFPVHNGAIAHDSSQLYNVANQPIYGLFDVEVGFDAVNGGSIIEFSSIVRGLLDRMRAAGTQLRAFSLAGSDLVDDFTPPTDGADTQALNVGLTIVDTADTPTEDMGMRATLANLVDTVDPGFETSQVTYSFNHTHGGLRYYNGLIRHQGGLTYTGGTLEDETAGVATPAV